MLLIATVSCAFYCLRAQYFNPVEEILLVCFYCSAWTADWGVANLGTVFSLLLHPNMKWLNFEEYFIFYPASVATVTI